MMAGHLVGKDAMLLVAVVVALCVTRLGGTPTPGRDDAVRDTLGKLYRFETEADIASHGYPAETHHVITHDGYILEMHRVPRGIQETGSGDGTRPVVFLMHGLTGASNAWVMDGPNLGVAFHLADAGMDVWMGNARGNRNSRFHVTLNPDDQVDKFQFFDFTWEEIGMYDVASMVDYVLEYTGREKLHYIGHSQGGTTFLVLNSMRPEYNEKFKSAHLFAGVGYMEYFPDELLTTLAQNTDFIYSIALSLGIVEFFPPNANATVNSRRGDNCVAEESLRHMCDLMGVTRFLQRDDDDDEISIDEILSLLGGTGGASVKQFAHYGQNIQAEGKFRRYNHGAATNLAIYGTEEAPLYNLGLITVNTTMHYTIADNLLDERDVLAMERDMANAVARKIARDTFSHIDFVVAEDAKELVTDYVIEAIFYVENMPEVEPELIDVDGTEAVGVDSGSSQNMLSAFLKTNVLVFIMICLFN